MIIPVHKPLGSSSHLLAKQIGKNHQEKATHTGTLDPMADGVLVVLTGEDRFKKAEYSNWKKTYQFQILVGIKTDSGDLLGLIEKNNTAIQKREGKLEKTLEEIKIDLEKNIEKILPQFIGKQTQTAPAFSAQRIAGKSGFDLAKQGKEFELQKNKIEIFSLKIIPSKNTSQKIKTISSKELLEYIQQTIPLVRGDFRQKEIITQWENLLENNKLQNNFLIITLEAVTTKRTYIRSLIQEISQNINLPMTAFSITRTKNGPFSIEDCANEKSLN